MDRAARYPAGGRVGSAQSTRPPQVRPGFLKPRLWIRYSGGMRPDPEAPAREKILFLLKTRGPQPAAKLATVPKTSSSSQSKTPAAETPPLFEKIDIANMSLADLDLRCEDAREKMIAPLREAEIAKCKQDRTNDPAWCERFNADYGDGGRTVSGSIRPRMFDDLPECVDAMQERNRRR